MRSVCVRTGGKKEPFVVAEGVERMHHFAKNKQGLKTLELQRPNLSHSSCPESRNFIIAFLLFVSVCCCVSAAEPTGF